MQAFLRWVVFGLCAPFAALAEPPPRLPVEAFGKLPFISGPELSPDGTRLAFKTSVDGAERLLITNLRDASEPRTVVPTGSAEVNWIRWVNNTRLLVSVGSQQKFIHNLIPVHRLYAINADGSNVLLVGKQGASQFGDQVVHIPRGNADWILSALSTELFSAPEVFRIDVNTGDMRRVVGQREPIRSWYADADGVVRYGVGYYEQRNMRSVVYRASNDDAFRTIDRSVQGSSASLYPVAFTADPNVLIVRSSERTGRDALYEYNISEDKLGRTLFSHSHVEMSDVILSPDGRSIAGVRYVEDTPKVHWLDPGLRTVQENIDAQAQGTNNNIVSLSQDLTRMIVRRSGPTYPDAYFFYDSRQGRLQLIGRAYEDLADASLAPAKRVDYYARDGLRIPAYLTLPAGRDPKNLPLVLLPHGGPWARDLLEFDYWAQLLANRGYAVLQPNFRGSTGYGDWFTLLGQGEWGKAMQNDLEDAIAWAVSEGIADPNRMCIMGGSYGGYAALMGLAKTPDFFRCAVSFAGVSDLQKLMQYDRRFMYAKPTATAITGGDALDYKNVSPINLIDRFSRPLLLVHGTDDIRVPFDQADTLAKALKKAGKPVTFVVQEKGDHHLSRQDHRIGFLKAMETFVTTHNPPESAPAEAQAVPALLAALIEASRGRSAAARDDATGAVAHVSTALAAGVLTRAEEGDLLRFRASQHDQKLGRYAEAAADYASALERAPDDRTLKRALAWVLATAPDAQVRDGAKALTLAKEGMPEEPGFNSYQTLAAAQAEAGQHQDAAASQRLALAALSADTDAEVRTGAEARLQAYEAGKAWHRPPPDRKEANAAP